MRRVPLTGEGFTSLMGDLMILLNEGSGDCDEGRTAVSCSDCYLKVPLFSLIYICQPDM